ncbi:MAG: hypothetical protein GQ534_06760 [Candidatus Delongbacteria bacterium]|nr:hypothetical protein [Candidatus Delongbacteria bacterium]
MQANLLSERLRGNGIRVKIFPWHNKSYIKQIIQNFSSYGLRTKELVSSSLCISFLANYHESLNSNCDVIIFDRYKYTGIMKDVRKGIDFDLSFKNYLLASEADYYFYLEIDPNIALKRIKSYRNISFYETGYQDTFNMKSIKTFEKFNKGEFSEEDIDRAFIKEKEKDLVFYSTYLKVVSNCIAIDATLSTDCISNYVYDYYKKRILCR